MPPSANDLLIFINILFDSSLLNLSLYELPIALKRPSSELLPLIVFSNNFSLASLYFSIDLNLSKGQHTLAP